MRPPATILAVVAATALAACGSQEAESTPAACLEGAGAYLQALDANPSGATLAGGTPISACFVGDQGSGDLGRVGSAVVEAATRLNAEASEDPGGEAAKQLGFLVGSVEQGASETAGIHTDLVLRINAAARSSDDPEGLGAEFERSFGAGYAAAREAG